MPKPALIFDMDGLLVDSEPLAKLAMIEFLAGYDRELDPQVQAQVLGRRLPEAVAIVKAGYGLEPPLEQLTREYGDLRIETIRGNLERLPGVTEFLEFARENHYRTAVATSAAGRHAEVSLAEAGLGDWFDVVVTGDEVTHGKPAPDLFLLAAERLGVDPAESIVFEDAPNGVAAAQAAGMRVVSIPGHTVDPSQFPVQPDAIFERLDQAIPWLIDASNR